MGTGREALHLNVNAPLNKPLYAQPDSTSIRQAAQWYAQLSADPADTPALAAWQKWHDQCDMHRQAWAYVERLGEHYACSKMPEGHDPLPSLYRRWFGWVFSLMALFCLAGAVSQQTALPHWVALWRADVHLPLGEPQQLLVLADGSQLWVSGGTALDIDPQQRRIRLLQGTILAHLHPSQQPFTIETVHGHLKTRTATRFSVWVNQQKTQVALFSGWMAVVGRKDSLKTLLWPGDQLALGETFIETNTLSAPDIAQVLLLQVRLNPSVSGIDLQVWEG